MNQLPLFVKFFFFLKCMTKKNKYFRFTKNGNEAWLCEMLTLQSALYVVNFRLSCACCNKSMFLLTAVAHNMFSNTALEERVAMEVYASL